jgi:hypothetical protein
MDTAQADLVRFVSAGDRRGAVEVVRRVATYLM